MKKTKSILAVIFAAVMLLSVLPLNVYAELPPITDLTWNDDFSVDFSFDGAAKYSFTVYIDNRMIFGYGSTEKNRRTREDMLPYLTSLARHCMDELGYSGDHSFDFIIFASDDQNTKISDNTKVSKTLNIEDVAAGKLSPDEEKWKYLVTTSNTEKLSAAFRAVCDLNKAEIENTLIQQGISYDEYIALLTAKAAEMSIYTYTGTLAQVMEFCFEYNQYSYNSIKLVNPPAEPPVVKKISEVNITITAPKAGQKVNEYTNTPSISCSTEGVKVVFDFSDSSNLTAYENNTRTWSEKFYSGNSYDIAFLVSFEEGYAPAEYFTVKVNGHNAEWVNDSPSAVSEFGGYYCTDPITVQGNFFQNIITFFHNLITKIKYPGGMPS